MIWDDLDLHSMLMGPAHELGMFEGRIPRENLTVLIFFSSVILAKNQWISIRSQNGRGHMNTSSHGKSGMFMMLLLFLLGISRA